MVFRNVAAVEVVVVVVQVGNAVAAENELGVIALELEGAVKTHYKICKYFTLNIYKKCDSMIHNVECVVLVQHGVLRDVSYEFLFLGVFFGIGRAAYNISH